MLRYTFAEDAVLAGLKNAKNADAQAIGTAIEALVDKTPTGLEAAARAHDHICHQHFEWDDAAAGYKYRLDQARLMFRAIRIVSEDDHEPPIRAFFSVPSDEGRSYVPTAAIRLSLDAQWSLMKQLDLELLGIQRRFREITEVCDLVAQAREKLKERMARAEAAVPAAGP